MISDPSPHNHTNDAGYWLTLATRILAGDIRPEEARHILKLGSLQFECVEEQSSESALTSGQ